jgi:hypothetical protein
MDHAVADAEAAERISKAHAFEYRDGLVIALLALTAVREVALTRLEQGWETERFEVRI